MWVMYFSPRPHCAIVGVMKSVKGGIILRSATTTLLKTCCLVIGFSPRSAMFENSRGAGPQSAPTSPEKTSKPRSRADNFKGDGSKTKKRPKTMARKYGSAHGQYVDRGKPRPPAQAVSLTAH